MNTAPVLAIEHSAFKSWLLSQNTDDVVGYRGELENCPISRFLRTQNTDKEILVAPNGIAIGDHYFRAPEWVENFSNRIDNCTKEFITRDHALRILREI